MYKMISYYAGRLSAAVCLLAMCLLAASCSGDDGGGGSDVDLFDTLVGSEWRSEGMYVGDNGEYEESESLLKFTSATRAEQHTVYSGMEWNFNGEYVPYSGEGDTFFEYTVSGGKIILRNTGDDSGMEWTLTPMGDNTLTDGSNVYTLVKAGTGTEDEAETGGNPETGIAGFVTNPVKTFSMEFSQGARDFKVEYEYSGNKVTRMLRSGSESASYTLSYSDTEVVAKSSLRTYTFGLGSYGYANYFTASDYGLWSCRASGDNDGYIKFFSVDGDDYHYFLITYSGGNISRIEEYDRDGNLACTYNFSYTSKVNRNGLYPEASFINTDIEFLRYLGFLGKPCRNLVDKIDFKPADSSYGTMEFTYEFDSQGNVTSYRYTSDPVYITTDRRKPSPVFKFTY